MGHVQRTTERRSYGLGALAGCLLPLATAGPALAQDAPADVETVVVTAERAERPLEETAPAITVLTRQDLERRQVVVVSDALAQTPGVSVNRNGGQGSATSVRIRGAEADQTAVLIDGVKLNDPAAPGGGFDFGNLLTGDLERIEVLRGPQSVLWGSQAIGGVVNLLTARPGAGPSGRLAAEAGSLDTGYLRGAFGYGGDRAALRLSAGVFTTSGVSAFRDGAEADAFRSVHASGRLDFDITQALALDLRAYHASSRTEIDGFRPPTFAFTDTPEFGEVRESVGYAGLRLNAGVLRHRLGYALTRVDRENRDPSLADPVTFESAGRNGRLEYQGVLDLAGWRATFGAESERSEIDIAGLDRSARLDSAYAQGAGKLTPDLTLTAGLRRDEHETFGGQTTGQAGLAWTPDGAAMTVRANVAGGFKAPSLFQLYSDFGNEALQPEEALGFDLGLEQRWGEDVVLSATAFARETENQIDFFSCFGAVDPRCANRPFGFYENLRRTGAYGLELAAEARRGPLALAAAYTFLHAENAETGARLARRPEHALYASADYLWPNRLSTGLGLQHVGERFDDAANRFPLEAYTLIDLRAAYPLTQRLELYGRVENLADEAYEQARLYGSVGRTAALGLRARF
jgi:vitamin B12 transporter